MSRLRKSRALLLVAAVYGASVPSIAAPSTSKGEVSVAQVEEMLSKASTDKTARQVLMAYLAGMGEAAGVLVAAGSDAQLARCKGRLSLSEAQARRALETAKSSGTRNEIAATPLILRDMMKRAGCRLGR